MSSSSKTLLFAVILTAGACGASLFRKPPGTTAVAPAPSPMTHRLDGPRVVVGPDFGDVAPPGTESTARAPGAPHASMRANGDSQSPPEFPEASPIGSFPLSAPPTWSRDEHDGGFRGQEGGGQRHHRVEDGDTLAALAARYLGDATRASEIHAANRDVLPASGALPIGVDLVIPPSTGVPRGVAVESASVRRSLEAEDDTGAAFGSPDRDRSVEPSPQNPIWMSEPTEPPASKPVAPGAIRPASETPR